MASGGVAASKRESLMCSLCLEIFTLPRLLPCHHTFCEQCLKDLAARHPSGRFPCPSCRRETTVPPGGISAFQTNFYIDRQDLERARDDSHCLIHISKEMEFFCVKCDQAICLNCKLTEHEMHETKDLIQYGATAKTQLLKDKVRLAGHLMKAKEGIALAQKEAKEVEDKKFNLQKAIHDRHATMLAAIDKYRDEALASLDTVTEDILSVQNMKLRSQQDNFQEMARLEERLQKALDRGAASELVTVAREMRSGRGSEDAVQKLTTTQMKTVCRPVLHFSAMPDATFQHMRDYMGSAAKREMALSEPEMNVVELFKCREDPDTDVYHICPMHDDTMWVSYEPHMLKNDVASVKVDVSGHVYSKTSYKTPVRLTKFARRNGKSMNPTPKPGAFCTYAKKRSKDLDCVIRMNNRLVGNADIKRESVVSESPIKTRSEDIFPIRCGLHRAFDVDTREQLFAVVEEGETPAFQRIVQLYRCPEPDAIATYSPPVTPFQPSDVCFYTLGGQEMLLVADELNDAIHVVNVQDGCLSFSRYLAPGSPLLVQPTALNTDTKGRLWVACRGGRILICTPSS